ncbi:hypothetical protein LVD15_25100 [Fulvivirga maritima]|uniref:hypothetical protein n=1 Tax=Fulvivirga maritima TaxID=2904247 RepID=UPI001F3101B1|nr:hypothetical protein [Fulvivirga maritima]UII26535.1 hypothetical protein LVD15_25100 [Fulvivirga maritima]
MSRSRRKTKVRGITTAKSEKEEKRKANRRLRRQVNQKINKEEEVLPELREVSDVWAFSKDGKRYDQNMKGKDMRK